MAFSFSDDQNIVDHNKVWKTIFLRNDWLDCALKKNLVPILVGHDVSRLYNNTFQPSHDFSYSSEMLNICLVTGDFSGELVEEIELLKTSLGINGSSRRLYEKVGEVILEDACICLNIISALALGPRGVISMDPKELFSKTQLSSAALFWNDYQLRIIGPDDVVGIGGKVSDWTGMSLRCAIELTHPKINWGRRWNQTFENKRYLTPIEGSTEDFVKGWKYTWIEYKSKDKGSDPLGY